ncbi:sensor protein FixL [Lachnospiraceae bacterium]|nr:sensor protein FixL [Lachnospiraceae bacterium]
MGIFFDKDSEKSYTYILYFCYFAVHSLCYLCLDFNSINLAVNWAALFLVVKTGYEGGGQRKTLAVVLGMGIGLASENLAWMLFINGRPKSWEGFGMFFSVFCFFILEVIVEKTVKMEKELEAPALENFILIFIPAGSIYIANELVGSSGGRTAPLAVSLCFLLIVNVFVFYLYENIMERYLSQKDREMTMLQIEMYRKQLLVMKNADTACRALRHDMKHHTLMVSEYIREQEYQKALAYLGKMNSSIGSSGGCVSSGNETVDSILNYIKEETDKMGGRSVIHVGNLERVLIDDFDINVVLSNLLSNACEAMEKAGRRELAVHVEYDRGSLVICISNTYNGVLNQKDGKYLTTKKEWKGHGIGLASVKRTVDKYGGEMKIDFTREKFQVMVLMFVPSAS